MNIPSAAVLKLKLCSPQTNHKGCQRFHLTDDCNTCKEHLLTYAQCTQSRQETTLCGRTGPRLYKETPADPQPSSIPSPPKAACGKDAKGKAATGKGSKGRGKKGKDKTTHGGSLVPAPAESAWELVASSTEELQAVGEVLVLSSVRGQSDVGDQVRTWLLYCHKLHAHRTRGANPLKCMSSG